MKPIRSKLLGAIFVPSLLASQIAFAVTSGQVDTFEDGTTQGWVVALLGAPHPAPPVNVPTGGPAGVDDNYLLLTAVGGVGAGNRLSVINFMGQWSGNYLQSGINEITMDVQNLGPTELDLRLLFADPLNGPPQNEAISSVPVHLFPGSGWTKVTFPILPSDLTAVEGSVGEALMNTTEFRIYHSGPNPIAPGPPVVALLGVDNIRAVPDASFTGLLLGVALSLLAVMRRAKARI
jgi:hypothetical protein